MDALFKKHIPTQHHARLKSLHEQHHGVGEYIAINGITKKSFRAVCGAVHDAGPIFTQLAQYASGKAVLKLLSKKYKLSLTHYIKKYVIPTLDHATEPCIYQNNYYAIYQPNQQGNVLVKTIPHDISLLQQDIELLKCLVTILVEHLDLLIANAIRSSTNMETLINTTSKLIKQRVNLSKLDVFEVSFDCTFDKIIQDMMPVGNDTSKIDHKIDAIVQEFKYLMKTIQQRIDLQHECDMINFLYQHNIYTTNNFPIVSRHSDSSLELQFPKPSIQFDGSLVSNNRTACHKLFFALLNTNTIHRSFTTSLALCNATVMFYNHDGLTKIKSIDTSTIIEAIQVLGLIVTATRDQHANNDHLLQAFQFTQLLYLLGLIVDGTLEYKIDKYCTFIRLYRNKLKAPLTLQSVQSILSDVKHRFMDGMSLNHNVLHGLTEYVELCC